MSIRPGYDKYYLTADCVDCGAYTGVQYAYRFGEDCPTVRCSNCKKSKARICVSCNKLIDLVRSEYHTTCQECSDIEYIKDYERRHYGDAWSDELESYDSDSHDEYILRCERCDKKNDSDLDCDWPSYNYDTIEKDEQIETKAHSDTSTNDRPMELPGPDGSTAGGIFSKDDVQYSLSPSKDGNSIV